MKIDCYYINLDSRPDRDLFMRRQLSALGISAIRVPASTGSDVSVANLARAEVGCIRSHLDAWDRLLASDADAALILEDDAILVEDVASLLRNIEGDWFDILRLEWRRPPLLVGRQAGQLNEPYSAFRLISTISGTAAYVITRAAAARLRDRPAVLEMPFDNFLFGPTGMRGTRVHQVFPAMAIALVHDSRTTPEAESDIDSMRHVVPRPRWERGLRRIHKRLAFLRHIPLADLFAARSRRPEMPAISR